MGLDSWQYRLWKNVRMAGGDACWEWRLYRNKGGYGNFGMPGRVIRLAHRMAYETVYGPIPSGLHVLHRCDNPGCCRPDHLFLGTPADNCNDKLAKNRGAKGERISQSKLKTDDVLQIKAAYNSGRESQKALANRFGVGRDNISRIVNGKRWKHLHGGNK